MLDEIKEKIAGEIERLMYELQFTLPKTIQKAVELGDLSENAEYTSALERQQFVQARLNHLTQRMQELSKIDLKAIPADRVGFGSRVKVKDVQNGEEVTYTIVSGDYIDIDAGQISMTSPIGSALMGKHIQDEVQVQLPRGERHFKVVELTTLPEMVKT